MAETILVVEDSVTVRTVTRWVAESAGLRVLEAATLQEASDLLSTEMPSTILLDYHLPDGAGIDFCRNIRANSDFDAVRVILVHGDAYPFDPAEANAVGATGTLKKPFRSQTLLDVLSGAVAPPAPAPSASTPSRSVEDAMKRASEEEEEIIFVSNEASGAFRGSSATLPPPPAPTSAATALPRPPSQSGLSKLPPMPGSGVHRLPPPGGQPITVAGRGTTPRSPTGAHRAITDDLVEEHEQRRAQQRAHKEPAITPVSVAPASVRPTPEAETGPVQTFSTRRNEATAEVNVLDQREIKEDEAVRAEAPKPPESQNAVYQVTEAQLRDLVDERTKALVEELLPNIARQALAHLLRTELNEQIIRMGVTRRVNQFIETDLPNYAQQALDRRLKQDDER